MKLHIPRHKKTDGSDWRPGRTMARTSFGTPFPGRHSGKEKANIRTVGEIRETGAAWVTEDELEWLCDHAAPSEVTALQKQVEASRTTIRKIGEALDRSKQRARDLQRQVEELRVLVAEAEDAGRQGTEWGDRARAALAAQPKTTYPPNPELHYEFSQSPDDDEPEQERRAAG